MAVVALMASSGGYFLAMVLSPPPGSQVPDAAWSDAMATPSTDDLLGQRRPDFTLRDTDGIEVSADDFDGTVLLVNFWATWCSPCVEEMPMLSGLQQKYAGEGVQIIGIALDDANRAREFAADLSIKYPVLVGQADVVLTGRRFGNATGMLPFSVLVDTKGIIRWTRLGALNREDVEAQIQALR